MLTVEDKKWLDNLRETQCLPGNGTNYTLNRLLPIITRLDAENDRLRKREERMQELAKAVETVVRIYDQFRTALAELEKEGEVKNG